MLSKKLPSCASVSVLNKFTVPTALGSVILLLTKIPKIIETANKIKKEIPVIQKTINDLNQQNQQVQPQQVNEEVKVDMG